MGSLARRRRPAQTAADRWVAARLRRLERDPTVPPGAELVAMQVPGHRRGASWHGWQLHAVGVAIPDPSPAVIFSPERDWPVLAIVTDDGHAVTMEWRFLRVAPPTEAMWLEARWRPGATPRLIPSPYRYANEQELDRYPQLVRDGVAFLSAKAKGHPPLHPTSVRTQLYDAWRAHVEERRERPSNEDLMGRLDLDHTNFYARVAVLRRARIAWPPD